MSGRPRTSCLPGTVHGFLTVVAEAGQDASGKRLVLCRCECGKERIFASSGFSRIKHKSCGCRVGATLSAAKRSRVIVRELRLANDGRYHVPLTRGLVATIDAASVDVVRGMNWYAAWTGWSNYALRRDHETRKAMTLHRAVMEAHLGEELPDGHVVDHIDGDGLNNTLGNLRVATGSQNVCNSRLRSDTRSGFKGVSWDGQTGKWMANIHVNGKRHFLGRYTTPEAAAAAYAAAAPRVHGEFARLA